MVVVVILKYGGGSLYVYSLLRKICNYDPFIDGWVPSPRKIVMLGEDGVRDVLRELEPHVDVLNGSLYDVLQYGRQRFFGYSWAGNYVRLYNLPEELFKVLYSKADRYFAYTRKYFDPNTGRYEKDFVKRYWIDARGEFATYRGLTPRLVSLLDADGVFLFDPRIEPPPENYFEGLRDYQREVFVELLRYLRQQGAATVQMATGAGKTYLIGRVVRYLMDSGVVRRAYFLSLNTDLLVQARDFFGEHGLDVGLVMHGRFEVGKPVVAATVQTLWRALGGKGGVDGLDEEVLAELEEVKLTRPQYIRLAEDFRGADLVIIDECHHVPARTVWSVLYQSPRSLRIGLSATPFRDDERDLDIYSLVGDIVPRRVSSSELIDKGYLVPAKIHMVWYKPRYADSFEFTRGGADLWQRVKRAVMEDPVIPEIVVEIVSQSEKPIMVLVREIKQGEMIARRLRDFGVRVRFLSSEVPVDVRKRAFDMLRSGQLDVIVATTLADEGLDLPALRTLILVGGGKSKTKTYQRIGRVLRPAEGKDVAYVYDLAVNVRYFRDHALERERMYRMEPSWSVESVRVEVEW